MRRRFDPYILSAATVGIVLPGNLGAALFIYFAVSGLYLAVLRPRSWRLVDPGYAWAAVGLAVVALAVGSINGSLPEDLRWASYPLYYAASLPMLIGFGLIRDPLRQVVLGARIAMVVMAVWAAVAIFTVTGRYGFGSNAANTAYVLTFIAILTRIRVPRPPRFLASRMLFFYLAIPPVLLTGTRAVLAVFALALVSDLVRLIRIGWMTPRQRALILLAPVFIISVSGFSLWDLIGTRISNTRAELSDVIEGDRIAISGLTIRLAQWRGAMEVISERPVFGRGGSDVAAALHQKIEPRFQDVTRNFDFSHNAVLDELMQRGIVGFAALAGFFVFCFMRIYRQGSETIRESASLIMLLTAVFGSLHYLLVVDRHVALYALYFGILMSVFHLKRRRAPKRSGQT